mmetsp:Transcript_12997/g.20154  ORF Transcript_12997/g.20154 Transcript_12997/m.20154 type:complete len:232 (+) Transcript_12997:251-946(+)|eukprot:CAMPEP_0170501162 /NCGR_PEP_ID=MMETSP0208-20121228/37438_1 /TAXON_ID=197538 /ORGANISM="Strombidium inclinatum, Strain S3" /LENGTH=231 /DNA_ID=CAMNT_0010779559 /DNA_START=220 /DNA_END=915 /DNA_ORIENTATION=+
MSDLSIKKDVLRDIFEQLNYRKVDRINSLELMACLIVSTDGTFEEFLSNVIFIFGFTDQTTGSIITEDEFNFFLDCFFRSILAFVSPPKLINGNIERHKFRKSFKLPHVGLRVTPRCVEQLAKDVFSSHPNDGWLEMETLKKSLLTSSSPKVQSFNSLFRSLNEQLKKFVIDHNNRQSELSQIKVMLGQQLLEMRKNINKEIIQIEEEKKQGTYKRHFVPPEPEPPKPQQL